MFAPFTPASPTIALSCAIALGCFLPATAASQETQPDSAAPSLAIELNSYRQLENTCRLIFMASNRLGEDLTSASFETVLINTDGIVDRLTVFDFQELHNERTRVRQFDLADTRCDALGSVLINGAASCQGDGIDARLCMDALTVSTRTDLEIAG